MADIQVLRTTTVKGQQKLSSMEAASKVRPVLTIAQANQLFDAAKFAPEYLPYKDRIVQYITEIYQTLPEKDKLPFEALIESANNPCSQELTGSGGKDFVERIKQLQDVEKQPDMVEILIFSKLYSMASLLCLGYQEQFREHWLLDSSGNIIGLKNPHNVRQPKCDAYIKARAQKWRPGFADVGYGRTRKHKKRSKKTRKHKRKST